MQIPGIYILWDANAESKAISFGGLLKIVIRVALTVGVKGAVTLKSLRERKAVKALTRETAIWVHHDMAAWQVMTGRC